MTEEIKKQLLKWIFDNHLHHSGTAGVSMSLADGNVEEIPDETSCEEGESPYVNSLKLEEFIDTIELMDRY